MCVTRQCKALSLLLTVQSNILDYALADSLLLLQSGDAVNQLHIAEVRDTDYSVELLQGALSNADVHRGPSVQSGG